MGRSDSIFKLVKDHLVPLDLILAVFRQRPESVKLRICPGLFHDGRDPRHNIRMAIRNVMGLADIRVEVIEFDRLLCRCLELVRLSTSSGAPPVVFPYDIPNTLPLRCCRSGCPSNVGTNEIPSVCAGRATPANSANVAMISHPAAGMRLVWAGLDLAGPAGDHGHADAAFIERSLLALQRTIRPEPFRVLVVAVFVSIIAGEEDDRLFINPQQYVTERPRARTVTYCLGLTSGRSFC